MAGKKDNKSKGESKNEAKGGSKGKAGDGGKLKPATSINVRHILVSDLITRSAHV